MDVLKDFVLGFPEFSKPKDLQLYNESEEVVFGTFNVLVSDKLIATIPPVIHYVSLGRKLDSNSTELRPHLAILARVPTRKVEICKAVEEGSMRYEPLLGVEHQYDPVLTKDGWNCLFLIENIDNLHAQIGRIVKNNTSYVNFFFSENHKAAMSN